MHLTSQSLRLALQVVRLGTHNPPPLETQLAAHLEAMVVRLEPRDRAQVHLVAKQLHNLNRVHSAPEVCLEVSHRAQHLAVSIVSIFLVR
jgi:hypothetical protein